MKQTDQRNDQKIPLEKILTISLMDYAFANGMTSEDISKKYDLVGVHVYKEWTESLPCEMALNVPDMTEVVVAYRESNNRMHDRSGTASGTALVLKKPTEN